MLRSMAETRIGPYRLLHTLGAGGMGEVFLAERADAQFEQRVAIKVVTGGNFSRSVQSRLKVERQILAQLDHPNIAHLLDGGSLPDGTAYLVMEYVDGLPIDAYCDANRLDVVARLKLFQTVCAAVHYAHRNLVVHRDLKPSNILVNAAGVPKLLDFGIAKLLDDRQAVHNTVAMTHANLRIMTPDHASPEQVRGLPITTSSDVYVLGVLLYRLLTGVGPFVIASSRLTDIERAIGDKDPPLPSHIVTTGEPAQSSALASARDTTAGRLRRQLKGDLDNIVLMAMRKEPERRYGSSQQMASDIQRYLDGKPVIARRDTMAYRSTKFVRRHWLPVTVGASMFALILAFATTAYVQAARIAAERDRVAEQREMAERERLRAEEISTFLVDLFKLTDLDENRANQVTARELLDSSAKRLRAGLQNQPASKAALLATVGAVYDSLGQFQDALPLLDESLHLQPQANDRARIVVLLELGRARMGAGDLANAEAPLQNALRLAQTGFGAGSEEAGRALWQLGRLRFQLGQIDAAKQLFQQSLGVLEKNPVPQTDLAAVLDDLAKVYSRQQRWTAAKQAYERALELDRHMLGEDHPRVTMHLNNLGVVAQNMGELKQAEVLYREAIRRHERDPGERRAETVLSKGNYGVLLQREGRLVEAEPLLRDAVAETVSLYGADHYAAGYARVSLAILLQEKGAAAEAESEYRQALAIYDKALPPNHQFRAAALMHLALLLVDRGRGGEALSLSEQSIRIWSATSPDTSPSTAQAHSIHAFALAHLGRTREAADELSRAVPLLLAARGPDDPAVRLAEGWLKSVRADPPRTASTAD